MANTKPPQQDVVSDEDVLFFYKEILSQPQRRSQKNVIEVAKAHGVNIQFINPTKEGNKGKKSSKKLKTLYPEKENTIYIFNKNTGATKLFLAHCRNAFAHQYIKIENDTLRMLD